jgi:hypothetical protein
MRRIREQLSATDVEAHGAAISRAIARRARRFGVVRWSFVGAPPSMRVEAWSRRAHHRTRSFIVRLPSALGFRLRVEIVIGVAPVVAPLSFTAPERVDQQLAPGAPILVGADTGTSRAGVAAIVVIDAAAHIVTCGHAFLDGGTNVFCDGDPEPIATLTASYLDATPRLDAAICALSDHGRDLLLDAGEAPTWFQSCRAPDAALNGEPVVFWPTSEGFTGGRDPVSTTVLSYLASTSVLFDGDPRDGFVELPFAVTPGDSGSLLATSDAMLGLCSGEIEERWSLFTPLSTVMDRLRADHGKVDLWDPTHADQLLSG